MTPTACGSIVTRNFTAYARPSTTLSRVLSAALVLAASLCAPGHVYADPATSSQPAPATAPATQTPAAPSPKITSSTPPPAPEGKQAASTPAVFPYRLERPITPRNEKGEKEMAFPLNLYDESADTRAEVKAACQKAAKENKRVLVIFGENYCGFCAWLHDTLVEDPRIKELLATEYVVVFADLGKPPWDKNLDVALEYGLDLNSVGAPAMAILEAATQRPIQALPSKDVLAKPMTMQRVFEAEPILRYLTASRVARSSAQEIIGAAQRTAATDKKRVMLCFVSSKNEPSTKLRRMLSNVEIATMLERDLVIRHIDLDRVTGAAKQLAIYAGPAAAQSAVGVSAGQNSGSGGALPWYIVLEPGGKLVVDSYQDGRNLGLPSTDADIKATLDKFAKACPSLSAADRKKLEDQLTAAQNNGTE